MRQNNVTSAELQVITVGKTVFPVGSEERPHCG